MLENNVSKINFKGFMVDTAQTNWISIKKLYSDGDPRVPLEGLEQTFLVHWFASLDKIMQKYI